MQDQDHLLEFNIVFKEPKNKETSVFCKAQTFIRMWQICFHNAE